jgi:hypothetical protein
MHSAKELIQQSGLFEELLPDEQSTISTRLGNRLEALTKVRESRKDNSQEIGYASRPFLLCNLPIRKVPDDVLIWERRNGHFFLRIEASPKYGLPFGSDRLIPILVATLAVLQQSREVRLGSAADICRLVGMDTGGYSYRRIMEGFQRVFSSTIYFGTDRSSTNSVLDTSRVAFFDRMKLWYDNSSRPAKGNQHERHENVIYLSEPFWQELQQHRIPVDLNVVRALKDAPANLDFFLWLSLRSWTVPKGVVARIPLFGPEGLTQHLGSAEYSNPRRFRQKVKEWLNVIQSAWSECPASVDGDYLLVRHAEAINPRLPSDLAQTMAGRR